jgi:hypothetical protein
MVYNSDEAAAKRKNDDQTADRPSFSCCGRFEDEPLRETFREAARDAARDASALYPLPHAFSLEGKRFEQEGRGDL